MLPYGARGLLLQLWRKVGHDGRLELGRHGLRGVAGHVGSLADWPAVEVDLKALLEAGAVIHHAEAGQLEIVGYVEHQGAYARTKAAERMRRKREHKDDAPEPKRTDANAFASVRPSSTDEIRLEEKREEEKIPDNTPKPPKGAGLDSMAVLLLGELSAARLRVDRRFAPLKPVPGNLKHIRARLDKHSAEDIRHVIAVCEARAKHDAKAREYFDAVSPFRESNIGRWLGMSLEQASQAPPLFGAQTWPTPRAPPRQDQLTTSKTATTREIRGVDGLRQIGINVPPGAIEHEPASESDRGNDKPF
jgi:hypothetical protein